MKYWTHFSEYKFNIKEKKCEDIFTFDIETTSCFLLNNKIYPASFYDKISGKEKDDAICLSFMYIWQFGINDSVYYGRTWEEFYEFLKILDKENKFKKIVYVHNLSFEFQFMRNIFEFTNVFAREKRHLIKCKLKKFNFEFRCSLFLSNVSLAKLSKVYHLPVEKKVGDLDYSVLRNSKTPLSEDELGYCENDCLVLYEYIKLEKKMNQKIPLTYTGHVRNKLKERISREYKKKVKNSISSEPIIYNRLLEAFAGRIYTCKFYLYRKNFKQCY